MYSLIMSLVISSPWVQSFIFIYTKTPRTALNLTLSSLLYCCNSLPLYSVVSLISECCEQAILSPRKWEHTHPLSLSQILYPSLNPIHKCHPGFEKLLQTFSQYMTSKIAFIVFTSHPKAFLFALAHGCVSPSSKHLLLPLSSDICADTVANDSHLPYSQ